MNDTLNGGAGNDLISPGFKNDTVHARGGNDLIFGGQGIDILYGEAGDDHIRGDEGSDILYGGAGEDILHADGVQNLTVALNAESNRNSRGSLLSGGGDDDILVGNNGQDTLLGGAGKDILIGSAGDDNLVGDDQLTSASIDWNLRREVNQNSYTRHFEQSSSIASADGDDDTLFGGAGNDWLFGQLGNDMLDGGTGEDILFGGQGNDTLLGGDDDDILTGDSGSLADYLHGDDVLDGGQGEDTLLGGGGSDFLYGGLNNDRLFGDGSNVDGNYHGNDYLEGGEGADELVGGGKADRLYGGQGNDKLFGDSSGLGKQYHGDDILFGGQGNDELTGHGGNDMLDGGADDDIMVGDGGNISLADGGNDILYGRDGEDNISGNGGDDTLYGGADNDQLFGDNGSNASDGGNDSLYGGSGRDILKGDGGNDTLTGGTGTDTLYGGIGDDTFIFQAGDGVDTIRDYDNGDQIQLKGVNASAIKARQAAGHDGSYLAIDYTASDTIFIKNGLSMPLDIQLNNGQFDLQALLDKGLDYRGTDNAETVTIQTAGANTLATFAGDDILIDNGSDNQLQGGQNNDTYIFGLNNGQDIILDASGDDTIQFEEGIGVDDIKFIKSGAHLVLSIIGSNNRIVIANGYSTVDNQIEKIEFFDGQSLTIAEMLASADANTGQIIHGTLDDDMLHGGQGNDLLLGDKGDDTYLFNLGDGHDTIDEFGYIISVNFDPIINTGTDKIIFGDNIDPLQLSASRGTGTKANDLRITIDDYNSITIKGWFNAPFSSGGRITLPPKIEFFEFSDGRIADQSHIEQLLNGEKLNFAPIVISSINDEQAIYNEVLNFTIPASTFSDPDGDVLTYSATLADGSALPDWLSFNKETLAFIGTPPKQDYEHLAISVLAQDGGGLQANATFGLDVNLDSRVNVFRPVRIDTGSAGIINSPKIATLKDGSYVVAWQATYPDSQGRIGLIYSTFYGNKVIEAQRYNKYGQAVGEKFQIANSIQTNKTVFSDPEITALKTDGFLVTWTTHDGRYTDVYGQLYDDAGQTRGSQFRANGYTRSHQSDSSITALENGGFVVVWNGSGPNSHGGVFGELYNAAGQRIATDIDIATVDYNNGGGYAPGSASVAAFENGNFIVTWFASGEMKGQIYTAEGNKITDEFAVLNRPIEDLIRNASVTILEQDRFVVTWEAQGDGSVAGVFAQVFFSPEHPETDVFLVNTTTYSNQKSPKTTALLDGGFVVTWHSQGIDGEWNDTGIFGQRFDSNGQKIANEFFVDADANIKRSGAPSITALANGDFVIVWSEGGLYREHFKSNLEQNNTTPILQQAISEQASNEDLLFTFTLPVDTFTDSDAGDSLTFTASLADSGALPTWLSFDVITQTFSGTPDNGQVGLLELKVTATDNGGLTVSDTFSLTINNTNDAPIVNGILNNQTADEDSLFSYQLPVDTFSDVDAGDSLGLSATLADGSALPIWLNFDSNSQTLSGTAPLDASGDYAIKITATDNNGLTADASFALTINDINPDIVGGAGNETLTGTDYADVINSGEGDDVLIGGAGNDTLIAGKGSDWLQGGEGNDTLVVSDDASWPSRFIAYNAGSPGKRGTRERVSITAMQRSHDLFDGGEGFDTAKGTDGNDAIFLHDTFSPLPNGTGPRVKNIERFNMGAGDDIVDLTSPTYSYGDVELNGEAGNDVLWGSAGNDTLNGGTGDDKLSGGAGNDLYLFGTGDGHDQIRNYAPDSATSTDTLQFGQGIEAADLWFERAVNDLKITVYNTGDDITIKNWYANDSHQLDKIQLNDGQALMNNQLDQLVQAMATFGVPAAGTSELSGQIQDEIAPVIAASWG